MNSILKITVMLLIGLSFLSCSRDSNISIKSEWRDDGSYSENYDFGLVNNGLVSLCANYYSGTYQPIDGKYNLLSVLGNVYKNEHLNNPTEKTVAQCSKKVMSQYTPQDIILIISSNDENKINLLRKFIGTIIQK